MRQSPLLLPLPLLAALTALAGTSHAQSCTGVTPDVRSYSTATAGPLMASGPFFGHPAVTSVSNGVTQIGFNVTAASALTIDNAYFSTSAHVGGEMNVSGTTSNSAIARTTGDVYDCLLIEGYAGSGRLHVPIHLTGDNTISASVGGNYEGNAGGSAGFVVACMAYVGQGPLLELSPHAVRLQHERAHRHDHRARVPNQLRHADQLPVRTAAHIGARLCRERQ